MSVIQRKKDGTERRQYACEEDRQGKDTRIDLVTARALGRIPAASYSPATENEVLTSVLPEFARHASMPVSTETDDEEDIRVPSDSYFRRMEAKMEGIGD